jgi:hypothetical protein
MIVEMPRRYTLHDGRLVEDAEGEWCHYAAAKETVQLVVSQYGDPAKTGMRDWFAGMAMQGLLAGFPHGAVKIPGQKYPHDWAQDAYIIADAMLAERERVEADE